jgi:hypothetical protein
MASVAIMRAMGPGHETDFKVIWMVVGWLILIVRHQRAERARRGTIRNIFTLVAGIILDNRPKR